MILSGLARVGRGMLCKIFIDDVDIGWIMVETEVETQFNAVRLDNSSPD